MRPFMSVQDPSDRFEGNGFLIDGMNVGTLLKKHNTPFFVTSLAAVKERAEKFKQSLKNNFKQSEIFYALKANSAHEILTTIKNADCGVDIVSIGEWNRAREAGILPSKICFAGPAKQEHEWKTVLNEGIGYLVVEHIDELNDILNYLYSQKNERSFSTTVCVRLNPCLDVDTHPHLKTGAIDSKFGILFDHLKIWLSEKQSEFKNDASIYESYMKPLTGLHMHIGSQIYQPEMIEESMGRLLECANYFVTQGINLNHVDVGGGLFVDYEKGVPLGGTDIFPFVDFLSQNLKTLIKNYPALLSLWKDDFSQVKIALEPGRSMVASSTVMVTKVLYTKSNHTDINFCYVDAGMNDFPRPSLYGAVHAVECVHMNLNSNQTKKQTKEDRLNQFKDAKKWEIVGPLCESGDFLHKGAMLPNLQKGDVLAFFEAGAYCRSMANEYNSRPLTKEVFV